MHLKLEKFANLCRNMNNESSLQSERAQSLQEELKETRQERDEMAAELEKLRADVQVYEKEREENRHVQRTLREYEEQGLQQAEEAIAKRDKLITKLAARLETTLDTLAMEREQQRQRRQIIFPPSMRNGNHYNNNNSKAVDGSGHHLNKHGNNGDTSGESSTINGGQQQQVNSNEQEVDLLRQQLLEAQQKLESSQLEAKQRETALLFRCETLETQLDKATTSPTAATKEEGSSTFPPANEQEELQEEKRANG
jgi:hypothetical protein